MVTAGVQETTRLLENKFDYIFFTGMSRAEPAVGLVQCGMEFSLNPSLFLTSPIHVSCWAASPYWSVMKIGLIVFGIWCQDV